MDPYIQPTEFLTAEISLITGDCHEPLLYFCRAISETKESIHSAVLLH